MLEVSDLPHLNASLNLLSTVLIVAAIILVKSGRIAAHRAVMKGALLASAAFLTSYLIYHFNAPIFKFEGQGIIRIIYYFILVTHVVLAILVTPAVLITAWFGLRDQLDKHKRMVRWVAPVWLYVTVTGVLVYYFLYQLPIDAPAVALAS